MKTPSYLFLISRFFSLSRHSGRWGISSFPNEGPLVEDAERKEMDETTAKGIP